MPTAYAYSRFSSAGQAEGDSLRRQTEAAAAYSTECGLDLDSSVQDLGVSGYSGRNRLAGALGNFLTKIEQGEIEPGSYFLIDSFDRLTREAVTIAVHLFVGILLAGVKVVTLNDRRVYDQSADMMEVMFAVMHLARSHEESREKGRKISAAHSESKRRAREEGYVWHSLGPAWLKCEDSVWRVREDKADVIRRIFAELDDGMDATDIAKRLNAEGVSTIRDCRNWRRDNVLMTARKRAVLGEYQPKRGRPSRPDGPPIPGYYPQIIALDQFRRVQARLEGGGQIDHRVRPNRVFVNLFRGLMRCTECGAGFVTYGPHGDRQYRCSNFRRRYLCRNSTRLFTSTLEPLVLRRLAAIGRRSITEPTEANALRALHRRSADAADRLRRVLALAEKGIRGADNRAVAVQAELDEIEASLAAQKPSTIDDLQDRYLASQFRLLMTMEQPDPEIETEAVRHTRSKLQACLCRIIERLEVSSDGSVAIFVQHSLERSLIKAQQISTYEVGRVSPWRRRKQAKAALAAATAALV